MSARGRGRRAEMSGIMDDLFGEEAKIERDAALARVRANGGDWRDKALLALSLLPPGAEVTGEDVRLRVLLDGLPQAHHHNAWGELIKAAVANGRLIRTGKLAPMKTRKSHARQTPVYRVAIQ